MPCRDYDSDWGSSNSQAVLQSQLSTAKKNLDNYARMLCALMGRIENMSQQENWEDLTGPDLRALLVETDNDLVKWWNNLSHQVTIVKWWDKHQIEDRKREERERKQREAEARKERIRKEALAKLSDEERKLLGIRD